MGVAEKSLGNLHLQMVISILCHKSEQNSVPCLTEWEVRPLRNICKIPTKNQNPIALKAGQRVMLIKTPKGVYLRYRDQIVKIRVPHGLLPFGGSSSGDQSTGNAANPAGSSSTSAGGSRPGSAEIRKKTTPTPENKPDVV